MLVDDLLVELKDKLQVSWDDKSTNESLIKMIKRGLKYFNGLCGTEFTFTEDSTERELLLERCRYDWNNALDDFEKNFQSELSRLILDIALQKYKEEVTADGSGTHT